jgi:enamine deaminase RidA (YjgF/YER057c/UK114 family)
VTESVHGKPPHRVVEPKALARPSGYAHGVVAAPGRTLFLAGQVGWDRDGRFAQGLAAQADKALENLAAVLAEAGSAPEHVVSMRIYVVSADDWRARSKEVGEAWRRRMGRWFPAITLVQVARLYERDALVEIEATAVVPG